MGQVVLNVSMSLDGYIEDPQGGFDALFAWYGTAAEPAAEEAEFASGPVDTATVRAAWSRVGAIVVGRRLFDLTQGWGGRHPLGVPVVVVTHTPPTDWPHPGAPFTFVTTGVADAITQAQRLAGDQTVAVGSAGVAWQALELGLLDGIALDVVPVLLGGGSPPLHRPADRPRHAGRPRGDARARGAAPGLRRPQGLTSEAPEATGPAPIASRRARPGPDHDREDGQPCPPPA